MFTQQLQKGARILSEMGGTPIRLVQRISKSLQDDVARVKRAGIPGGIIGLPLGCLTLPFRAITVPGTMAIRAAQSTDSVAGATLAGLGGAMVGTACVAYVGELAVLWHLGESLVLVGRANERAEKKLALVETHRTHGGNGGIERGTRRVSA